MADEDGALDERLQAQIAAQARIRDELARLSKEVEQFLDTGESVPWWVGVGPESGPATAAGSATSARAAGALGSVTVVVPVYNAYDEVRACVHALARHTTYPATLLLIDDASTDPRIGELMEMARRFDSVRVLHNVENMGFTATVNRALRSSTGDVVLLNSDTVVGPRWLEQLAHSAYSSPATGTVTAISENAGAFSVPTVEGPNELPRHLSFADVARLLASGPVPPTADAPTGSGFCLYIKAAVIAQVGEFDAESFPRGYGEENDFCMRALHAGWRNVVDGRTFVHHEREASFGKAKAALSVAGRAKLDELHPDYTSRVRAFMSAPEIAAVRERAGLLLADAPAVVRPRLLFVIHDGGGGAVATNADLVRALEAEFESYVFSSDRWSLRLQRVAGAILEPVREWPLEKAILLSDFSRPDYRAAFGDTLDLVEPELVHVRHVFKHTLDAPKMAAARSVPVVMSIHDHYTICPTIHLLDNAGRYCGGRCTPGHGTCPTLVKAGPLPHLKHSFVYQWRDEMDAMLRCVDAFVTTSPHTRSVHQRSLPGMRETRFELIEHGRDLRQATGLADAPVPRGRIRILVPGNTDRHKGAEFIQAMLELDLEHRLEFHFVGEVAERWRQLGVMHGAYHRRDFLAKVGEIRPAFIGIFSVVAETYNHSLTEAWAAGIPAIATDIGALGERLRAHGGGFLVPVDNPAAALQAIFTAADDPQAYRRESSRATLHDIPSVADMTRRYAELYRDVLDHRRTFAAPAHATGDPLRRGVWRVAALMPGRVPTAYVRTLRRYHHPEVAWKLRLSEHYHLRGLDLDGIDFVVVQRHAVPSENAQEFVHRLRRERVPLVLDLDDHLLASEFDDAGAFAEQRHSLRVLLGAAALVTVSTPALAQTVGELSARVAVVPNALDERLFLPGTGDVPPGPGRPLGGREVRLVFAGSPSHSSDLVFLREVVELLERRCPGQFALDVVGGEPQDHDGSWYRRRPLTREQSGYPSYVALLRGWRPEWDIAVAPLLDTEFNRHKSDLKFLEYSGLGLPGVYSDVEPYAGVRNGLTGLRAANEPEAFAEAVIRLSEDNELHENIRQAAWDEVTHSRLLRHHAGELLALVGSVATAEPAGMDEFPAPALPHAAAVS